MNTLEQMRMFLRVVEAGSFTAAARQTQTTTAYASRAISGLESRLGARLLNRNTRHLALTEAGERYFHRCEQILACVEEAEAEAGDARARPTGRLRLHAMTGFGQHYVVPMVCRYQERFPAVTVELTLAQRVPGLLEDGYDVALVLARGLSDSGFVSQRLGQIFSIVCASPDYLRQHGFPETLSDLSRHICLQLHTPAGDSSQWRFKGPRGVETVELGASTFTVNVADAMAVAICEGMGIGILPASSAFPYLKSGALRQVLPDYTADELRVFALYPSRQYLNAKTRTWVEFLRDELPVALSQEGEMLRSLVTRA